MEETMAEIVKRPLMAGQFVWAASKTDGKFKPIIGPDPLQSTDDDIFVLPDRTNPTKVLPVDTAMAAIQDFITLTPGQYAVVLNPTSTMAEDYPNGQYSSGRNEMKKLLSSKKRVITSGSFPTWPGQKVEVRNVHNLSTSQFLLAVVESTEVDDKAPYYELTVRCAQTRGAVVENRGPEAKDKPKEEIKEPSSAAEPATVQPEPYKFRVGQRIVIRGNLTPTYIPPSGIEIVTDDSNAEGLTRGSVVKNAVVLGPTEFCVLLDEDGKPQTQPGPGRVFPGPYDRFRTDGSRDRVYAAYHLRTDRGILLRVVADEISKIVLAGQLPSGSQLDKVKYNKGDEIFIGGFDAYLVPSNAIEVIDPNTREPHIGNNHDKVYVKAIGVDQKSGVYVANVETGNVATVGGETKLLLDPRKQKHMIRKVPGRMWNLMIAQGEPHKTVSDSSTIETPWALTITVPNNEAALITSKSGRKVVVGPGTQLLEYEEWLEALTLSRGRPKSDRDRLETCFLRVTGNTVTDRIVDLETRDNVLLDVDVSYGVEFVGDTPEDKIKWFNYKDYVMLLCANLRSRLRAETRKYNLDEIYKAFADFMRDVILGQKPAQKPEGEKQHRPGLLFAENNMHVIEVDVLSVQILNEKVATALENAATTVVVRNIEDTTQTVEFNSDKLRDSLKTGAALLAKADRDRAQQEKLDELMNSNALEVRRQELTQDLEKKRLTSKTFIEVASTEHRNNMNEANRSDKLAEEEQAQELQTKEQEQEIVFRTKLADIEKMIIAATAAADVSRLEAIQDKLVEALEGLGNKELMTVLAQNLPKAGGSVGLLAGLGGITALKAMVKGNTKFESVLNALTETPEDLKERNEDLRNR
jgi:hypothetical protein